MRSFLRYFLLLAAALAGLTVTLPASLGAHYPAQPGPTFDDAVRNRHTKVLQDYRIELALMGDSVLEQGVDMPALIEALDAPAYAIAVPGST